MWTTLIPYVAKQILPVDKLFPHADSHACWRQNFVQLTPKHTIIDAITNLK